MYEIRFKKKIQLLGYPDFPRLEITGVILRFSFREPASMAANFRSRMLHHGKISRVFSVFSPPKVANQRPVWSAYRGKKGKGWKEGEEKERREEPIVRDRGKKRARSAKVGGLLLSFFLFFFLAIFHHFLPARPSPRETLFTWTVRVVGGINWHSSRPDTRLYFRSSLVMKKAPLFVTARTPRTEEGGYERRFFEGTSLTRFSRIWNRGWR